MKHKQTHQHIKDMYAARTR